MINRIESLKAHINKLGLLQTINYLRQRLFKKKGELIKIKISGLNHPLFLRNKFYDTHIFYQIFIKEEVDFDLQNLPNTIIDCGANIGLSTLFFKKKYPDCKIYSIEPEVSNFKMLQLNIKNYKDVFVINAAVWHNLKELYIVDPGIGHASFIMSEDGHSNNIVGTISTITINDLIERIAQDFVDLIKIDIEGSEFDLFSNNPETWINKIKCLAVEIHERQRPGSVELIGRVMENNFVKSERGEYTVFTRMNN